MIVAFQGGLGNQMFQYAFGRSVSIARGEELFFQKVNLSPIAHRDYYLDAFQTKIQWADGRMGSYYYGEDVFRFDPGVYTVPEGSFFNGFWQTEKYFNVPVVREELQFKAPPDIRPEIAYLAEEIKSSENSTFIHVRRSDYLREPHLSYHGVPTEQYYKDSIKMVRNKHADPQFFVFSDDPAWCREMFPPDTVIETGNHYADLYLMTLCKHAIIANSSFGWFGAWLNDEVPGRTVIAPKQWFQDPNTSYDDIVPLRWEKI